MVRDVPAAAREALKRGVRGLGVASSPLRALPDFLVIGAKRGGTTSFYFDLLEHPSVVRLFPPPVPWIKPEATKGVHYFDANATRSVAWYRSHFPTRATRRLNERHTGAQSLTGEASPYYLFHPAAAARAHAVVPQARLIAVLRDPVMRTYSHWKERRRNGAEPLDFPSALAAEGDRLAGERERLLADPGYASYPWEQQSYATQSRYADSLRVWVDLYGVDRLHVVVSEDYYRDPRGTLDHVQEFLGLARHPLGGGQVRNAAQGNPLDAEVTRSLAARFADSNQSLSQLLGRELPWR